jgi:hypothetical protein
VATARQLGVAAVAVALVLVAGYAWLAPDDAPTPAPRLAAPTRAANTPSSPPSTGAPAPASAEQWSALLAELDARRAAAFAQADVHVLDDVYAPGSAALAADRQAVRSLVAARATAAPVRHELRRARVVRSDAASTRLEVVDRMPSYRILDAAGATLRTVAARPDRTVVVDLTRSAGGWRINALTETSR